MNAYIKLLTLALIPWSLFAQESGEVSVPLSSPGEIGTLQIDIKRGSIKVLGTNRSEVLIKYSTIEVEEDEHAHHEEDHASEQKENTAGLKKISQPKFNLEISENDNEVDIESESWFTGIDLTIEVPRDFNLELENYTGKLIQVENVRGEINLESYTGTIDAKNVSGVVNASTYTGNITVSFNEVKKDQAMAFSNYTGKIELTLPPDYAANFKMKTVWGDIYSAFDMKINKSPSTLNKVDGENFKLSTDEWTKASLNGGGPEVMIKNFSGGIYLRKKG